MLGVRYEVWPVYGLEEAVAKREPLKGIEVEIALRPGYLDLVTSDLLQSSSCLGANADPVHSWADRIGSVGLDCYLHIGRVQLVHERSI
jgi:hypothetical protein